MNGGSPRIYLQRGMQHMWDVFGASCSGCSLWNTKEKRRAGMGTKDLLHWFQQDEVVLCHWPSARSLLEDWSLEIPCVSLHISIFYISRDHCQLPAVPPYNTVCWPWLEVGEISVVPSVLLSLFAQFGAHHTTMWPQLEGQIWWSRGECSEGREHGRKVASELLLERFSGFQPLNTLRFFLGAQVEHHLANLSLKSPHTGISRCKFYLFLASP